MILSLSTTVFLVFNIFNAHLVYSQCILGKRTKDKEFPDLSQIVLFGYTATVPVNIPFSRKTILVTEYYDVINSKGRVNLLEEGNTRQFLYFNNTKETFSVNGLRCETKHVNDFVIPLDSKTVYDWTYKRSDRIVLGPSAMLWNARDRYKAGKVNYMGKVKSELIRGIEAEFWRGCLNNDLMVVDYFFSVKEWHGEHGTYLVNLPLRIEIQAETSVEDQAIFDQIYEFSHFELDVQNRRNVFGIPTGYGCSRLVKDLPTAPNFAGLDKFYGAELRYTEADDDHVYLTNVYYVEDFSSYHRGYYYSAWDKVGKNGVRSAKDYSFIVYNEPNRYLYNVTKDKEVCTVKRVDSFDEGIPLPGDISVNLKDYLILGDSSRGIYMGQSKRRGLLCDAFEDMKLLYGSGSTKDYTAVVVTRYYLSETQEYETLSHDKGAPLQALMRIVNSKFMTSAELVVNIYAFSTKLKEKNKLFNIESCFPKSESKLLHLTFEVADEDITRSITGLVPTIKEQILELLEDTAGLAPIRIPEILVDFDTVGVHGFATILERPNLLLDFELSGHYTFEDAEDSNGLYTTLQCAKLCLESAGFCRAFSHCGAACYIAMSSSYADKVKASEECRLYKRLDPDANWKRIKTTDEAMKDLSSALFEEQFEKMSMKPHIAVSWINVKGNTEDKVIPLTSFEVSRGDASKMINSRIADFDNHFDEYKYGAKLSKEASHVRNHGSIPYQVCQTICLNDPECESLSSCIPVPECLTSYKHGDELEADDFVGSRKCLVVTRKYVDAFVPHPGIAGVTQAAREVDAADQETCAKACLNADDLPCRSFDFCPRSENKKDQCLLHSTHFFDVEDQASKIAVNGTGLCGHYSRNYVRDFKKIAGKAVPTGGSSKYLELTGITAENCAKRCIENGAFICNSFDHCDGTHIYTSSCYLHSKKEEDNLINSPVCNSYIRQYYTKRGDVTKSQKRTRRFKPGVVAGLAFFFFLIGCGLGIVVIFAHGWCTGKRV